MPVDQLTGVITGDDGKELRYPLQGQDVDQAQWLAEELGNTIRFNHATKVWHRWLPESNTWAVDKQQDVENRVIELVRNRAAMLSQAPDEKALAALKMVRKMFDVTRVNNALDVLATMPGYKTDGQDWDTEPYLLGCLNGVVDLRTGKFVRGLMPATSKVTKNTKVPFDPKAKTKYFLPFLRQITSGDVDLAAFYLQWFGYCLFGRNYEQKFMIMTGSGRNGKGALTHAVRFAMGEYDANANSGIYMKSRMGSARSNEARSDLMSLRGARLAVMSEPEGGQFNEELLKSHTGGDPIVARPLYGREMSWEPTHTIVFLTNMPPSVDDIGPAMSERVLVADFRERYEGAAADTQLYEKLEGEAPGILALLVQQAANYWADRQAGRGLWYPDRVAKASKAYIDANDPVGQAVAEFFVLDSKAKTPAKLMYDTYLEWHGQSEDPNEALSNSAFGALLQRRGFLKRRSVSGNVYLGIRPKNAIEKAEMVDA